MFMMILTIGFAIWVAAVIQVTSFVPCYHGIDYRCVSMSYTESVVQSSVIMDPVGTRGGELSAFLSRMR